MPNFTDSVGRGGRNIVHDVAALQGAFLILSQKGQKFWNGQINGKMSNDLIAGILEFEKQLAGQSAGGNASRTAGLLQPNGPITRQLKARLPTQYRSLKGIPETACLTIDDPYPRAADREKLKGMALHEACRKDLDRLIKAGADKLGLELVLDAERTDHKGRCVFTLKPHGVKCLDAHMRPQDAKNIPRPVVAAVAKHAASATTLDMPINASKLEVTTRQAQGGVAEGPERIAKTEAERRANFRKAVKVVDEMIAKGIIKRPAQDYILLDVIYKDEVKFEPGGRIAGHNTSDRNNPINEGTITIYRDGAVSLKEAIITYAHELAHFNVFWEEHHMHNRVEKYGLDAYDAYRKNYLGR